MFVNCRRDAARLRAALESRLTGEESPGRDGPGPIDHAWGGTLFLDAVTSLDQVTLRLLGCLVDRASRSEGESWPLRVGAGVESDPAAAVEAGRFPADLLDEFDKIRIDLGSPVAA